MKIRFVATLAMLAMLAGTTQATVLTFDGNGSNQDMAFDYGSNKSVADDGAEFVTTGPSGATPDITLAWGPNPSTNVLEFHNSGNWVAPMSGGKLQFDVDTSSQNGQFPADPTVDFTPAAGVQVVIHTLMIGTAADQHIADGHEPASDWTISLINLSTNAVVSTYTTTALGLATQGSGAVETVQIHYTGDPGVSYRLLFDDGGDNTTPSHTGGIGDHPRGGIDNLTFSQIPEPSTLALLALCGFAGLAKRRRS